MTRRACTSGLVGWVAASLLLALVAPAGAYVQGNYMYHFWRGLGFAIDGEKTATREINNGLQQLKHCRGAVERRTEKIVKKSIDLTGDEAVAYELVVALHNELRVPAAYAEEKRQRRILAAIEGHGEVPFDLWREDLAFVAHAEDAALLHDVEAYFAEQRDRDFAKGLAERERSVREWRKAVEAIRGHAEGIDAASEAGAARVAYLIECADRFEATAGFLQQQLDLARAPEGMLARYTFYALVALCYDSTGDSQQERIWAILRDTYRGKVHHAIELARQEGADEIRLARVARQVDADGIPDVEPSRPALYHLPEIELPFYHYYGTGEEYGGTTEIANELLKHNRRHEHDDGEEH